MPPTSKPLVLLVEDDVFVRGYAARVLRAAGYDVGEARTGAEALWVGSARVPDLVVTDLGLPDTTGARLVTLMRARNRPDLPVVFMSGRIFEDGSLDELITAEASFLPKPFLPEQLRRKVGEALAARRADCRKVATSVGATECVRRECETLAVG